MAYCKWVTRPRARPFRSKIQPKSLAWDPSRRRRPLRRLNNIPRFRPISYQAPVCMHLSPWVSWLERRCSWASIKARLVVNGPASGLCISLFRVLKLLRSAAGPLGLLKLEYLVLLNILFIHMKKFSIIRNWTLHWTMGSKWAQFQISIT